MGKQERDDCTDFTRDCANAWGTWGTCFSSSPTLTSPSNSVFHASFDHSPLQSHSCSVNRHREKLLWILKNGKTESQAMYQVLLVFKKCVKNKKGWKKVGTRLFHWEIVFWRFMFFLAVLAFWGLLHPLHPEKNQNKT